MHPTEIIRRVRDHYVEQFRDFVKAQRLECTKCGPEVKLHLPENTSLYRQFYCTDFMINDGAPVVVELTPPYSLEFGEVTGSIGHTIVTIKPFRWDDVHVTHDLPSIPEDAVAKWFQYWFDPEDLRHDPSAELSGIIHNLSIEAQILTSDFGTAQASALWEMLTFLAEAGAREITVGTHRLPDEN